MTIEGHQHESCSRSAAVSDSREHSRGRIGKQTRKDRTATIPRGTSWSAGNTQGKRTQESGHVEDNTDVDEDREKTQRQRVGRGEVVIAHEED